MNASNQEIRPLDRVKVINKNLKSYGLEGQVRLPWNYLYQYYMPLTPFDGDYAIDVLLDNGKHITIRKENLFVISRFEVDTSQFTNDSYVKLHSRTDSPSAGVNGFLYGKVKGVSEYYITLELPSSPIQSEERKTLYAHPSTVTLVSDEEEIKKAEMYFAESEARTKRHEKEKKLQEKFMVCINCDLSELKEKISKIRHPSDELFASMRSFGMHPGHFRTEYRLDQFLGMPDNEVCVVVRGSKLPVMVESLIKHGLVSMDDITVFKVGEEIKSNIGIKVDIDF